MELMNLTNQTIRIYDEAGEEVLLEIPTCPPAMSVDAGEEVVRTVEDDDLPEHVSGIPVVRHTFFLSGVLPDPDPDVVYVVGWAVLQSLALRGEKRDDLVAPDTSRDSAVRDGRGRIVGVKKFRVI